MHDSIAISIGYIFATFIAHPMIYIVSNRLWKDIDLDHKGENTLRPRAWHASITGVIERVLYVASLQIGQATFIGIWLALKTVGNWKRWSHGYPPNAEHQKVTGREFLNIFLIGSGLSLTYAGVGYKVIVWLKHANYLYASAIPLILIILTFFLYLYICWKTRSTV
jgi:hypothetical protein